MLLAFFGEFGSFHVCNVVEASVHKLACFFEVPCDFRDVFVAFQVDEVRVDEGVLDVFVAEHIQKLVWFTLLCKMCHHVKHIGLAGILADEVKLDYDSLIEHFCRVNGCTKKEFEQYRDKAFEVWENRSGHDWKQDFGECAMLIKR